MRRRRTRPTSIVRNGFAGCVVCWGDDPHWTGRNCRRLAVRHHARTTHTTWVILEVSIKFGVDPRLQRT